MRHQIARGLALIGTIAVWSAEQLKLAAWHVHSEEKGLRRTIAFGLGRLSARLWKLRESSVRQTWRILQCRFQ